MLKCNIIEFKRPIFYRSKVKSAYLRWQSDRTETAKSNANYVLYKES